MEKRNITQRNSKQLNFIYKARDPLQKTEDGNLNLGFSITEDEETLKTYREMLTHALRDIETAIEEVVQKNEQATNQSSEETQQ